MKLRPLRAHSSELLRIDLLRFVASIGIVWHHSQEFLHPLAERAAVHAQTRALALFVDMFFAISGFVIAYVYANRAMDARGYGRFLQRRVGRLIPLHWLTFALSCLFWAAVAHRGLQVEHMPDLSLLCMANTALLFQSVVTCGNGVVPNGVTWSISVEMVLYLGFPLLLLIARRRAATVVWAILLVALATWMFASRGLWEEAPALLRGAISFTIGINLCLQRHRLARLPIGTTVVLALLAVTLVLMVTGVPQVIVLLSVYMLVGAAVTADTRGPPAGLVRDIAPLGQMTYSIYMWHIPIITVMLNSIADKMLKLQGGAMAAMALFCYATILIVSYFSWSLYEEPMRRWIDRLGARRASGTESAPVAAVLSEG